MSAVAGAEVAGEEVGGAAVTGTEVGSDAGSAGTLTITFPAVVLYTADRFHGRQALLASNAARSYLSFDQGGTVYGVDTTHEGQGADCTVWNASLAGATRINVALGAGAQTGTAWATAVETALGVAGISGVSRVGDTITIENASGLAIGPAMVYNPALRGMWGMQRHVFGGATHPNQLGNMGGTGSVHVPSPNNAGRILGVYIRAPGSNAVRLGIANGPAYSTTPAAFSDGVEGSTSVSADDGDGYRLLVLSEPMAMSALQNKWISFRGVGGGNPQLNFRDFADTPVGRGDVPESQQLLFSTAESDPTVAIYTGGAYTHGSEAGPFNIYAFVGFIYECPTDGEYPGDGGLVVAIGTHQDATTGGPTATVPATMSAETFGMRHPIPWDCEATAVDLALVAQAADEDMSVALYRFLDTPAPSAESNPLLYGGRQYGTTGTGYQRHTFDTPVALTAGWIVDVHFCAGNLDGVTPADTISVAYDPNPGGDDYWSTAWVDDGRTWSDMIPAGGLGLGVVTEYRTVGASGGDMPEGNPEPTWPDPFDVDASDDHSTENHLRHRLYLRRVGITGSEV